MNEVDYPIFSNKRYKRCQGRTVYLYQKRKDGSRWAIVGIRCPKCNFVETEKGYRESEYVKR